jgi:dolichol-phosphate mannosyltransferase
VRTLIVLPTYDEAPNIATALRRVRAAVPSASVLVVDDNSPDGTADLAEAAGAELGSVEVLRRRGKGGLGSAYRAGFAWGLERGYEVLVEMDADLSHDPSALPCLVQPIIEGADLVVGSRYIPGGSIPRWPWHRRALSRYGNRYAAFVLGLGVRDATSGFRAYRASVLRRLDMAAVRADGYGFQIEMAYLVAQLGGRIQEVPIAFTDRTRGVSKMSGHIVMEALVLVSWWGARDRFLVAAGRPVGPRRPPTRWWRDTGSPR